MTQTISKQIRNGSVIIKPYLHKSESGLYLAPYILSDCYNDEK